METISLFIETGYKCKDCNSYLSGRYVFLKVMYFRGQCKCSKWLVKSTCLNSMFYYDAIFILQ